MTWCSGMECFSIKALDISTENLMHYSLKGKGKHHITRIGASLSADALGLMLSI
jgi:hypothetical protein